MCIAIVIFMGFFSTEDSFQYCNGQNFSTIDQDNDVSGGQCAQATRGGC